LSHQTVCERLTDKAFFERALLRLCMSVYIFVSD